MNELQNRDVLDRCGYRDRGHHRAVIRVSYHRVHFHRHQSAPVAEEGKERNMSDSWRVVPDWALDLLELQYYTTLQNEAILAKLEDRSTRLSDKDQKALDQLMNILDGTNAKIDSAKQDQ